MEVSSLILAAYLTDCSSEESYLISVNLSLLICTIGRNIGPVSGLLWGLNRGNFLTHFLSANIQNIVSSCSGNIVAVGATAAVRESSLSPLRSFLYNTKDSFLERDDLPHHTTLFYMIEVQNPQANKGFHELDLLSLSSVYFSPNPMCKLSSSHTVLLAFHQIWHVFFRAMHFSKFYTHWHIPFLKGWFTSVWEAFGTHLCPECMRMVLVSFSVPL